MPLNLIIPFKLIANNSSLVNSGPFSVLISEDQRRVGVFEPFDILLRFSWFSRSAVLDPIVVLKPTVRIEKSDGAGLQ